jgi:hypothetical protein
MSALERVTFEAEQLDPHSQFLLAERLTRKLGQTAEHRSAWAAEAKQRFEAYERGEIKAIDADEVFRNIRALIGK